MIKSQRQFMYGSNFYGSDVILNSLKSSYADLELKRIGGSRKKNAPFVALKGTLLPIRNVPKCNKTGHKA